MPPQPDLPEPAHPDLDSMLSRKFGKEVANYFSGSPLNRVAFLRTENSFLTAALTHPTTLFLLLNNLAPLGHNPGQLAYATYADVKPLIGDNPYEKSEEELIAQYNSTITIPQLLFLGLDERKKEGLKWKNYQGVPYFALDVTPKSTIEEQANSVIKEIENRGLKFIEGRMHMALPAPEAAVYAQARALLDWNARNPYCGQCGQLTLSVNGGFKRTCPPTDMASVKGAVGTNTSEKPTERPPCATRKGISNLSFPRTDPTVIMAVISSDSSKVLLGRQKKWPPYWYSTLAGFIEPGESVEEAVRREVWEESGVYLGRVVIHSTQPWPYPANLMIGAIAQCIEGGEEIVLKHDPELEDAKWVGLDEVREALRVGAGGLGEDAPEGYVEGNLRLPPKTAIANQLLQAVTNGILTVVSKM